jgi:hypothetical protein
LVAKYEKRAVGPGRDSSPRWREKNVGDLFRLFFDPYQSSFSPNCTWREVVEVLVITPAVGETPEGVKTMALGWLKFARLRRLNISARN